MKRYRYNIGGYEGDQLQPLVRQLLNDADADPLGRTPLRELVEELYRHLLAFDAPVREAAAERPQEPSIDCPVCGQNVRQVTSATLSLALWQHWNWMHSDWAPKREAAAERPTPEQDACLYGHTSYHVGCGSCVLLFKRGQL